MLANVAVLAVSWMGWIVILAGIYFIILFMRGIADMFFWLIDEFIVEPREQKKRERRLRERKILKDIQLETHGKSSNDTPTRPMSASESPGKQTVR